MKPHKFRVTVKHDGGRINITTVATSEQSARQMVCKAEGCPDRAIIKVTNKGEI